MTRVSHKSAVSRPIRKSGLILTAATIIFLATTGSALAQSVLTHHIRRAVREGTAQAVGHLPSDQVLKLDMVLPLRNQTALETLLSQINDSKMNGAAYIRDLYT